MFDTNNDLLSLDFASQIMNFWIRKNPDSASVDKVPELKEFFAGMVISPVDKCGSHGIALCQVKYCRAASILSETMQHVSNSERNEIILKLFSQGRRFTRLPFCKLRKASLHRFPTLKAWIKFKSVCNLDDVGSWTQMSYRPLMGYQHHHWKSLLSLAGKMHTALIRLIGWGFGLEKPRTVVERINTFNTQQNGYLNMLTAEQQKSAFEFKFFDIKQFFI